MERRAGRPRRRGSIVKTNLESGPPNVDGDGRLHLARGTVERRNIDPFACFGNGSSSGSDDEDLTPHHRDSSAATASLERGQTLKSRTNDEMQMASVGITPITSTNFEVFDTGPHNSGKGLRANVPYKRGDEILRESAVMRIRNTQPSSSLEGANEMHRQAVQSAYDSMHETTQRSFMDLSSCNETIKTPMGVYDTNSFRLGDDDRGGLFLTISRINHSCRPNVNHFWRENLQQTVIFATRDIEVGEEFFTTYGPSSCMDTKSRREYLHDRFAFNCNCEMCIEGNANGGDDRMAEIQSLQEDIALSSSVATGDSTANKLESVTKCLALMHEQGIGSPVYCKSIYHNGYEICIAAGDNEGARSYLTRELKAVQESEGVGSANAIHIERVLNAAA